MCQIENIKAKIYEVRGIRVMLDRDLASLYQVEVRVLNQAVKRNLRRFPPDFMFRLDKEEWDNLKSHFVISSWGGSRTLPYAFTEQGLAMLSGILNSDIAVSVNIAIMRAFVDMRNAIAMQDKSIKREIENLRNYVEEILADQNEINESVSKRLEVIDDAMAQLQAGNASLNRTPIGFIQYKEKES